MHVIRSALFFLWLAITVVPWALVAVTVSIFTRGAPVYAICRNWLAMSIHAARLICGVRWRVQGMSNVPAKADPRAVILAPKHQSTWETFAFPMLMPHPLSYVFKRELLWIPFFGWAIGRLNMVHIDRSKRAEAWGKVAEQGARYMSSGHWIIMFPEGTRTPRGGQGPYKSGAARLAVTTGTPIVPIAVASARCWPRKSLLLRPGMIEVSIGPPIHPQGHDPDSLMRAVETWVEAEMRRIDPEAYAH